MASNALDIGGYDCKFVEDPPDALKCLICLSVTRDPQQHGQCGKLFCITAVSLNTGRSVALVLTADGYWSPSKTARTLTQKRITENIEGCKMASNALNIGGYDCKFVEVPPVALKCLICLSVARDPQQHGDCGKVFCNSCITEHKKISNDCPHCRQQLTTFNDGKSAQEVKSLRVRCDNLDNGCQWVDELRSLQEHLLTCGYALLPCTNQCKNGTIPVKVLRKDLADHLTNKCPRRQFPCQHCNENGEYKERMTTHIQTCPKVKVQCPNGPCQVSILRFEVTNHRSTCQYENVPCKYAEVGCKEKPLRKDLKTHEEDDQLHLRITKETVLEQNKKITTLETNLSCLETKTVLQNKTIATLENKVSSLEISLNMTTPEAVQKCTTTSPCTFRLTHYQKHKKDCDEFYSPPFYTSPTGYKMCIRVDANGNGDAKGTRVSVFAFLMKGDNDDSLTWPFTGAATFELLNQLEGKNHHTYTTGPFPADMENISGRVVKGERATNGWGKPLFIPHTQLHRNRGKNCQYLRNDTLVFRVSVG